jgi:hypothetical protein
MPHLLMPRRVLHPLFLALGFAAAIAPSRVAAQLTQNAALGWQTIATPNFRIHYEPGLRPWAEQVAGRIEAVRTAVAARVGYTPPRVIDILIEDPLNVSNGSAWPSMAHAGMRFWATPPDPSSTLSGHRSWSEILSVHEYAHLAHLLRPSRNPLTNLNAWLSPVPLGPIPLGAPAWVIEGYATVIEGELTGAGRPNSVMRPAVLRQLALEGALPAYDALDATGPFQGGSMRYLVGSAFLEWLQARRGDSSLVHLWRRMTARQMRGFAPAFSGVFGDSPSRLYGRFVADLTAKAKAAEQQVLEPGDARGAWRQRFTWYTGAPAISPDGARLAVRLAEPGQPTRVVVFDTVAARDSADSVRVAKALARDTMDVAAYREWPRGWKRAHTLMPIAGTGFGAPRWLRDGERVLVVRGQSLSDGRTRPDLWMWHPTSGWTRRITYGEGIREADPLPSGAQAAGLRCQGGTCDVVLVDLVTGGVRAIAAGAVDRPFAGVRVSPAGTHVATAVQTGAIWRPAVVELATGAVSLVGPDDGASRYAPSWASDTALVVVSEASGVPNLERVALSGGRTALTRVTGAASLPDVGRDGRVWYLDLHARGYDLRTLDAAATVGDAGVAPLAAALAPAAPRVDATRAMTFAAQPVKLARPYGVGPLGLAPMTFGGLAADGRTFGLAAHLTDPIGRLALLLQAGVADQGAWSGGSVGLAWRGIRPEVQVQGWLADQRPSRQPSLGGSALDTLGVSYAGGFAALALTRFTTHGTVSARAGGSLGQLTYDDPSLSGFTRGARVFAFVEASAQYQWTPSGALRIAHDWRVDAASGTTNGTGWQRGLAEASVAVSSFAGTGLGVRARAGSVTGGAPAFEQFAVGGSPSPYLDAAMLSQRLVSPGVPFALRSGSRVASLAIETPGPLRLFHEWVAAGDVLERFNRLAGAEIRVAVPPATMLRLPATSVRVGVTHSLDTPWRRKTLGYTVVTITP